MIQIDGKQEVENNVDGQHDKRSGQGKEPKGHVVKGHPSSGYVQENALFFMRVRAHTHTHTDASPSEKKMF